MNAYAAPKTLTSTASWSRANDATFERCGEDLLLALEKVQFGNDGASELSRMLRQWLDDATTRQPAGSFAWGALCAMLLRETCAVPTPCEFSNDADRIASYLDAMASVSSAQFVAPGDQVKVLMTNGPRYYTPRPVSDGLNNVLGLLLDSSELVSTQRMRSILFDQKKWNPEPLLVRLTALLPEQHEYKMSSFAYSGHDNREPHSKLLNVLCEAVASTSWRPADSALFGPLWDYVHWQDVPPEERTQLCINLLQSMPSQAAKGIEGTVTDRNARQHDIDLFFPLPLHQCDAEELLHAIIVVMGMARDDETYFTEDLHNNHYFEKRLNECHPEIARMMDVHFTLFPGSGLTATNAEVLVEGFKALYCPATISVDTNTDERFGCSSLF